MIARRFLAIGAILGVVTLLGLLAWRLAMGESTSTAGRPERVAAVVGPAQRDPAIPLQAGPQPKDVAGQPALSPPELTELATTDRPPLANRLGLASTAPAEEPRIVYDVLNTYRRVLGVYPAGEGNRQIVNALLGRNPEKLPFIPLDHPRLNPRGEIVDAWSTPFFFHLNGRDSIEVRSAGADRALFTGDDIVAGPPRASKRPAIPKPAAPMN